MTDLVERLREVEDWNYGALLHEAADEIERLKAVVDAVTRVTAEAADEIERLKAENAKLRAEYSEICSSLFCSRGVEQNDD